MIFSQVPPGFRVSGRYLYDYNNPRLDIKAKQAVFSKILGELKSKYGSEVMLIPIAGDNNLVSLNVLMSSYGVSEQDLPVILIDEKIKITDVESVSETEKYLA
jgi:hypothetical protein